MPKRITKKEITATRKDFLAALAELGITEIRFTEAAWQYRINGVCTDCQLFVGEVEDKQGYEIAWQFAECFRNEIIDGFNDGFIGSQILSVIPNTVKVTYQGEPLEADTDINVAVDDTLYESVFTFAYSVTELQW